MFATVHLTDRGLRAYPGWLRAAPRARRSAGLLDSVTLTPAPLATTAPRPQPGRLSLLAFWRDRDAAETALSGTELALDGFDGLVLGLRPVRAIGSWTGLPPDLPTAPDDVHEGPAVVITIGRLRLLQSVRFLRTSAMAERHIVVSPGLTWATGLANPLRRTVATLSWWHDPAAMDETVRGAGDHREAMAEQARKDFHHESAFIRFEPLLVRGALATGRNPVPELVH